MKILFVCLGNICRSPLAEFVFRKLVTDQGLDQEISCASAATSTYEIGNPVYPPIQQLLLQNGIDCREKRSRQLKKQDAETYDLLIAMDQNNLREIDRICGKMGREKAHLLLDYVNGGKKEVDDPWYTREFDRAYSEILMGCHALLESLIADRKDQLNKINP